MDNTIGGPDADISTAVVLFAASFGLFCLGIEKAIFFCELSRAATTCAHKPDWRKDYSFGKWTG